MSGVGSIKGTRGVNLLDGFASAWRNRNLIYLMTRREVEARYRGSLLGIFWSLAYPLLMLLVYSFVFQVVYKMRWNGDTSGDFAIMIFSGLVIHGLFSECLVRSPNLIVHHQHLVKKVIFPLEILPFISLANAIFHAIAGFLLLIFFALLSGHGISGSILLLPIVLLPMLFLLVGIGWLLSSISIYLRDIGHLVGIATTVLLFLAPIFYPLNLVPPPFQYLLYLNPLTVIVENARSVLLEGAMPNWIELGLYSIFALLICALGYWVFERTREDFADAI